KNNSLLDFDRLSGRDALEAGVRQWGAGARGGTQLQRIHAKGRRRRRERSHDVPFAEQLRTQRGIRSACEPQISHHGIQGGRTWAGQGPARQGGTNQSDRSAQRRLGVDTFERCPADSSRGVLLVPDAADAVRWKQGIEFWQVARSVAFCAAEE